MPVNTEIFFDSNVLTYIFSEESQKATRSEDLLSDGGTISVQVLNECALVLRRKFGASWSQIEEMSAALRETCAVTPVNEEVHIRGLAIAKRYKLHMYDAMIVAAAVITGCHTLYSEDLHDGLVIDGLTIRNPYLPSGPA